MTNGEHEDVGEAPAEEESPQERAGDPVHDRTQFPQAGPQHGAAREQRDPAVRDEGDAADEDADDAPPGR